MRPHRSFSVVPQLPGPLDNLRELAWNLRFSWDPATRDLFRMLDRNLWDECGRNPVLLLGRISQARLEECAKDDAILANLRRVWKDYSKYLKSGATWFAKRHDPSDQPRIAYFSAEFGLSHCLPLYSGGLGVLAGDHLKSASDLGLPLVGVGLLYQHGYFRQYLNSDGWQQESYPTNDFHNLPLRPARAEDGGEVILDLPLHGDTLHVKIWEADVGRVRLVLLDTNVASNRDELRQVTNELYGGGTDKRLKQEYVLGVGGCRALGALGLEPDICHMNEGHSAFLALERVRVLMERDALDFAEARLASAASTIFTTHTPVHAAIDLFSLGQMESVFGEWRRAFGLSKDQFMDLGREQPGNDEAPFNMAVFALRMADTCNGVSRLHGQVSRGMWRAQWPGLPEHEVPITSVTNGIHTQTWISRDLREVLDHHLGPRWARDPADGSVWEAVEQIPAEVLWRTHEIQRERLVAYLRERGRRRLEAANATTVEIAAVNEVLDSRALTIGFARRFAPYKRGNLILRDRARLLSLLTSSRRPVQFIFAGKAHPRDDAGKKLIQEIVHFSREAEMKGRIVFVENYDIEVAQNLMYGVDVWLNNPRRPLEASGTSGMKAAANGAINLSVLDGWWDEAASEHIGWSIGNGEVYESTEAQDEIESSAIYDLLEHEIVPLFYDRGRDGLPRGWIRMMKEAMKALCPVFNTNRMVSEYTERCYMPASNRAGRLSADGHAAVRGLAAWKRRLEESWPNVRILEVQSDELVERAVGDMVSVGARVQLGGLDPSDFAVELYHGEVDVVGDLVEADAIPMIPVDDGGNGSHWFRGDVPCVRTGHRGFAVRVVPHHPDLKSSFIPGFIRWSSDPVGDESPAPALA